MEDSDLLRIDLAIPCLELGRTILADLTNRFRKSIWPNMHLVSCSADNSEKRAEQPIFRY